MNRLDKEIYEKNIARSRSHAKDLIKGGFVMVDGLKVKKSNTYVKKNSKIEITKALDFVGRGGDKLFHTLQKWHIELKDKIIMDVGSSTGGFVDCALHENAKKIFAIDVGSNQLEQTLKNNLRVVVMENTDIRNITRLSPTPDFAFVDVSFISLTLVLPNIFKLLKNDGKVIVLVKPQFEVGKISAKKSKGVIRNTAEHKIVLDKIKTSAKEIGFEVLGETESPILGGDGNKEFFLLLHKT